MADNAPDVGVPCRAAKPDAWYFERLPPTARAALANAWFDWASAYFYNRWKRGVPGYKTGADIAQRVLEADRNAASTRPKRRKG